jgi:hypothetical protein
MKNADRIRLIFRKRRRFTRSAAAKALGKSEGWIEKNRFSAENGGFLSWEEMVLLAYALWTRVQIQRALGEDAVTVFPHMERWVTLTVLIPAYKVIALRDEARRRRLDVSELAPTTSRSSGRRRSGLKGVRQLHGGVALSVHPATRRRDRSGGESCPCSARL